MEQSILQSTKKVLHIGPDDDSFDLDIMTHINSAFSTLNDIGVGPDLGFAIDDESAEWDDFLPKVESPVQHAQVKTFVLLHTRLAFDPPDAAYLMEAAKSQLEEVTVRLSMRRENDEWRPPVEELVDVIDAGDAG